MNDVLKNLMLSLSEQNKITSEVFRIGVHGSVYLTEPIDGFCDDGIFLLEERAFDECGSPVFDWYVVLVDLGNVHVYRDIPMIYGFDDMLKYFLMCCGSHDVLENVVLYGENKPYFSFFNGKLELK